MNHFPTSKAPQGPRSPVGRHRNPPLSSFSFSEAEELPKAVRVALRGIGNDEAELGLKDREVETFRDGRHRGRQAGSTSSGIRVERDVIVEVDQESDIGMVNVKRGPSWKDMNLTFPSKWGAEATSLFRQKGAAELHVKSRSSYLRAIAVLGRGADKTSSDSGTPLSPKPLLLLRPTSLSSVSSPLRVTRNVPHPTKAPHGQWMPDIPYLTGSRIVRVSSISSKNFIQLTPRTYQITPAPGHRQVLRTPRLPNSTPPSPLFLNWVKLPEPKDLSAPVYPLKRLSLPEKANLNMSVAQNPSVASPVRLEEDAKITEISPKSLKVKEDPDRRGVIWMVVFVSMFTGLALGDLGLGWFTLAVAVFLGSCWSALVVYILEEAFPIQW
ncbi:hypothetical protein P7C70_g2607, partial [Phenoliferia sp. Uapishka_3]